MKRVSTPLNSTLTCVDDFTALALAIYGNENGLDPEIAARTLEVCRFFKGIGETSDQALNYWKWHVINRAYGNKDSCDNNVSASWKNLFFTKSNEINLKINLCQTILQETREKERESLSSKNKKQFLAILDTIKDYALKPNANKFHQFIIAECHYYSEDCSDFNDIALNYYELSANQGQIQASWKLGTRYEGKYDIIRENLDDAISQDDDLDKAKEKSDHYYALAYKQLFDNSIKDINECIKDGCPINFEIYYKKFEEQKLKLPGSNWLTKLPESTHFNVFYDVAKCYKNGTGVNKNLEMAFKYYKKAALQKYPPALFEVARNYELGEGTAINPEETFKHWKILKDDNSWPYCILEAHPTRAHSKHYSLYIHAVYELAICYEEGFGTEINLKKAFDYYLKTTKYFIESHSVFSAVARCYTYGIGTDVNYQKAIEFYKKTINFIQAYNKEHPFQEEIQHITETWYVPHDEFLISRAYDYEKRDNPNLKVAVDCYRLAAEYLSENYEKRQG